LYHLIFLLLLLAGCAVGPTSKENRYYGEKLSELGDYGVVVGHAMVPIDSFPHDRKTTIIYLENIKTKVQYQYGDTQGPFYMKLPPGDYVIKDLWDGGSCHISTGLMIGTFFSQLPSSVQYLRSSLEKPAGQALGFKIHKGKFTDVGNILLTCHHWDTREKWRKDFTRYISDGKFQIYRPYTPEQHECGCKILRKFDGTSMQEMKKALREN
jgi:hypothetical protein